MVKNLPAMWETWVGKIPWRRAWQPTLVFLPRESPWTEEPGRLQSMGHKPLDNTEQSMKAVRLTTIIIFIVVIKEWSIGLPRWRDGKELACQHRRCKRCWFSPWVEKIPRRRA